MEYKYILDKSSKKFTCPKCQKKTFVRYINTENNEYLSPEFGRCDRENKCGHFITPKGEYKNTYEVKFIPPPTTSYHPYNLVGKSGQNYKQNNFVQFLKTIFNEDEVKQIILQYLIGTSKHWNGATVFWQIDNKEKVRHGKIMLYHIETGKRLKNKEGKAYISSVRSVLKINNFNLKQCLFGLHLINEKETRTIGLVESEKTAILLSIFKPQYIWLATGSKQGFKYEMLKPIKNYTIIAFPDKGEYNDWQNKAITLNDYGFKITVSKFLEDTAYKTGTDLADVFLDNVKTATTKVIPIIRDEVKTSTVLKKVQTITEMKVNKLAQKNRSIIKLINTFDLVDSNLKNINVS